ncbi:plastocyanin/azurin family copper-binding protein [Fodinibius sediminis]|uniref:Azurin n=1 Tax=Fodinibius sediminis TaxID=1214077 RepID=A0A521CSB2_9BACT|nr:plastocyanin/azurin family copper-binding protein [Fodinibius sediminis]SMO62357.1 Azurin [Fodinibius sediminis]
MTILRNIFLACFLLIWIPESRAQDKEQVVTIRAIPGMQYDKVRFRVNPGEEIQLVFENADDLDHNLLITEPGARKSVVEAALKLGTEGEEMDFIPETEKVLWATPMLSPGDSYTISFKAPVQQGVYPYVCTFPGHGIIMYGAMYVSENKLPPLTEDLHIPAERRMIKDDSNSILRPYKTENPPFWYRTSMPGAGPASIAVRLSENLSYCWDPDVCRLQYVWTGGFVDNSVRWSTKGDAVAQLMGTVFYREQKKFPLRVGAPQQEPNVEYLGFKVTEKGYPEFHYRVQGEAVYERIEPAGNGRSIQRSFRIPEVGQKVYFSYSPQEDVIVKSSKGTWNGSLLELNPQEAGAFTIIMKKEKE